MTDEESEPARRTLRPGSARRTAAACVWFLIVVAAVWVAADVAARFSVVLIPVGVALLLTALFSPGVSLLDRAGVPRPLGAAIVLIAGVAALGGLIWAVTAAIGAGLPELQGKLSESYAQVRDFLAAGPLSLDVAGLDQLGNELRGWMSDQRERLLAGAWGAFTTVGTVLAGVVLTLFVLVLLVADGKRLWQGMLKPLPRRIAARADLAGTRAFRDLTSYMRATVAVAFFDALGIGLGLWITGVPLALPLAALVFLGAFVPLVGAFVSGLLAVAVALVAQGPVIAVVVLAIVIAVQQLEGNVFEPWLMGGAVRLHPLVVGLAVATGVHVAGVAGALLAVPLFTTVRAVLTTLLLKEEEGADPAD